MCNGMVETELGASEVLRLKDDVVRFSGGTNAVTPKIHQPEDAGLFCAIGRHSAESLLPNVSIL